MCLQAIATAAQAFVRFNAVQFRLLISLRSDRDWQPEHEVSKLTPPTTVTARKSASKIRQHILWPVQSIKYVFQEACLSLPARRTLGNLMISWDTPSLISTRYALQARCLPLLSLEGRGSVPFLVTKNIQL